MIYPATLHTLLHTTTPDGETDAIEHHSPAMIALRDNGTWSLRYRDTDNEGQTALAGTDGWMSISRDGTTTSRLLFRVGERLEAIYRTPHGEFTMSTHATHYISQVDAKEGMLELHYELYLSDQLTTRNRLEVRWTREA